jgi:prepilin-type N-terminal cleavage/methylation domain
MRSRVTSPLRRGFTLIELLTVIAIIGVLAAIVLSTVGKVRKTALKASATADLRSVGLAILAFAQDHRQTLPGPASLGIPPVYDRNTPDTDLPAAVGPYLGHRRRNTLSSTDTETVQALICPGFLQHQPEIAKQYPHYVQNYTLADVPGGRVFGRHASGSNEALPGMKLSELERFGGAARVWALTNLDQQVSRDHPQMGSNSVTTSGWFSSLPETPVWGNSRLRVYFDGHVASVPRNAAP